MSGFLHIDGRKYLTAASAASLHGLSEDEVLSFGRQGKVRSKAVGQKTYIDIASLAAHLSPPPAPQPQNIPDIEILPKALPVKKPPPATAESEEKTGPRPEAAPLPSASVGRAFQAAKRASLQTPVVGENAFAGLLVGALLVALTSGAYFVLSPGGYVSQAGAFAASAAADTSLLEDIRAFLRAILGMDNAMVEAPRLDWPEIETKQLSAGATLSTSTPISIANVSYAPPPPRAENAQATRTIIERIIERVSDGEGGVSRAVLDSELQQLYNNLSAQIPRTDPYVPATQVWEGVGRALQIDSLSDITLSGVSFTGTGTTTFAGGISLSGGCVYVNGACLGSGSGTTGSGLTGQIPYYAADGTTISATSSIFLTATGNFGIGTTSPYRRLSVTDTVSAAQAVFAYDATRYTEIQTNSVGDAVINPSGDDLFLNDDNFWVCTGGSCPSDNPTGTGNLIVENKTGVGTTTPDSKLVIETQDATTDFLRVASSTAQSLLVFDERGFFGLGTSTPTSQFSISKNFFVGNNAPTVLGTGTSTIQGDLLITGKLDVSTIDPVYTIEGRRYATYGHSTVGIKEEVALKATPSDYDEEKNLYVYVLDFKHAPIGSDLWLFYRITDFGEYWERLVVTLTPSFDGRTFYEEHIAGGQLLIYADMPLPVSVRLLADRFDSSQWPNERTDGGFEGLKPPRK